MVPLIYIIDMYTHHLTIPIVIHTHQPREQVYTRQTATAGMYLLQGRYNKSKIHVHVNHNGGTQRNLILNLRIISSFQCFLMQTRKENVALMSDVININTGPGEMIFNIDYHKHILPNALTVK